MVLAVAVMIYVAALVTAMATLAYSRWLQHAFKELEEIERAWNEDWKALRRLIKEYEALIDEVRERGS